MKMTIITKNMHGEIVKRIFNTKKEADIFYDYVLRERHLYKCVWIEPTNKPHKRERIDLWK